MKRDDNSFRAHKTAHEIPHGSVEKGGQGPQRARRREWMSVNERTWRWAAALHLQHLVSTSEQISAYRLYFATERRLVLIGTCNWYNSQQTTRPGNCLTRRDCRTFFPRDSTLLWFSCFALIFARLFQKVSVVGIKGQLNLPKDFFKQRKCSECLDV